MISRKFSHRLNRDGTVDSICRECFITVANEHCESDLAAKERLHSCNPAIVERYRQSAQQSKPLKLIQRND
jgi:hypothetical protein